MIKTIKKPTDNELLELQKSAIIEIGKLQVAENTSGQKFPTLIRKQEIIIYAIRKLLGS